jgi:hypothetical protein
MNKEPRYKEVVVDFGDRVHGTGFPEIRPWRPQLAIPVEFVDVVTGTDSCDAVYKTHVFSNPENWNAQNAENCDAVYKNHVFFNPENWNAGNAENCDAAYKIGMLKMPKIAMLSTQELGCF